jgi:hypothetical protein
MKVSTTIEAYPNTGEKDIAALLLFRLVFALAGRVPVGAELPVPSTTSEGGGEPAV